MELRAIFNGQQPQSADVRGTDDARQSVTNKMLQLGACCEVTGVGP